MKRGELQMDEYTKVYRFNTYYDNPAEAEARERDKNLDQYELLTAEQLYKRFKYYVDENQYLDFSRSIIYEKSVLGQKYINNLYDFLMCDNLGNVYEAANNDVDLMNKLKGLNDGIILKFSDYIVESINNGLCHIKSNDGTIEFTRFDGYLYDDFLLKIAITSQICDEETPGSDEEKAFFDSVKNSLIFYNGLIKLLKYDFDFSTSEDKILKLIKETSNSILKVFNKVGNTIKPLYEWYNNKSLNKKSFVTQEYDRLMNKEMPKYIGKLNNLIELYYLKYQSFNYIEKVNKVNLEKEKQEFIIKLLCDELYKVCYSFVKNNYTNHKLKFNLTFVDLVFHMLGDLLQQKHYAKLDVFESDLLKQSEYKTKKKMIIKFYYLSIFYNNPLGNDMDFFYEDNPPVYNVITGFKNNEPKLSKQVKNWISKWIVYDDVDLEQCLDKTQIREHSILETAFYNKNIKDGLPIFSNMEYTPILVNLFKSVEELACDFMGHNKLRLGICLGSNNKPFELIKEFYDDGSSLYLNEKIINKKIVEEWKDEITLGTINIFIKNKINQGKFEVFQDGKNISQRLRGFDEIYAQKKLFEKRIEMIDCFNLKYRSKFDFEIKKGDKASDLLFNAIDIWRIHCRNNCLHKDDTISKNTNGKYTADEKVEMAFDFTMMILAMLCEWFWCLK